MEARIGCIKLVRGALPIVELTAGSLVAIHSRKETDKCHEPQFHSGKSYCQHQRDAGRWEGRDTW